MVDSKEKGSSFERFVCRTLSLWISKGSRHDLLWRSAASGGTSMITHAGDVASSDPLSYPLVRNFVVECKFRRDLNFAALAYPVVPSSGVVKFWYDLRKLCYGHRKLPMMIVKANRRKPLIVLNHIGNMCVENASVEVDRDFVWSTWHDCFVLGFDDFFRSVDPGRFFEEASSARDVCEETGNFDRLLEMLDE